VNIQHKYSADGRLLTRYCVWYFGCENNLAMALYIRKREVVSWGEFVPAEHVPAIERIESRDAA
jgi:hypothetical protein